MNCNTIGYFTKREMIKRRKPSLAERKLEASIHIHQAEMELLDMLKHRKDCAEYIKTQEELIALMKSKFDEEFAA